MQKVLAINPGSTSTKFAVYEGESVVFENTLRHTAEEIDSFESIIAQREWRKKMIVEGMNGFDIKELSAVVGRGGLVKPIEGGIYEVNERLVEDCIGTHYAHASNLGALLAKDIADEVGIKSYIVDPVVVDELSDIARMSGHPAFPRVSMFHALNSKAIARHYARDIKKKYEDLNLVVVHMGGGVSVSAHVHGRVVDTYNALSGDGCFSPERTGRVQPISLVDACFSGKYTEAEITHMLIGGGGLNAHLGNNSMLDAVNSALAGDEKAKLVVDAFCYNVGKDVGAMSTVMCGKVDAIIITGGIAYNEHIQRWISERVEWIAKVAIYPGEDELGALVHSTIEVLNGNITPKVYK
ncbi:MAG: butyrate kinase [Rikenellaceae bacterium]